MKIKEVSKGVALFSASLIALQSCGGSGDQPEPVNPPVGNKMEIRLSVVPQGTRATDTGFDAGDKGGLYVVNYSNGVPATLLSSGNHVDNMCFTYNGTWTAATPVYWKDNSTKADFYFVYPYTPILSVTDVAFNVKADQSTVANYKASELIAGKRGGVSPTETAVEIATSHLMSQVKIGVKAGNGFTQDAIDQASPVVKINGLATGATLNLRDMKVTAKGAVTSVTPCKENGIYKALVVPQKATPGSLITVTLGGRDYNLKKDFEFVSGKTHNFNVVLSKTSNGINVSINSWDDDGKDNGGVAE